MLNATIGSRIVTTPLSALGMSKAGRLFFIAAILVSPFAALPGQPPQVAHADVDAGEIIFLQTHGSEGSGATYTISKRSSGGTITPLSVRSNRVGTATEPDVSHDGSRVAFVDAKPCVEDPSNYRGVILMMNSDGSGESNITSPSCPQTPGLGSAGEFVEDTSPRWSPDGTQVAYSHQDSILTIPGTHYSNVIYKSDVATGTQTALTTTDTEYNAPSWSPADSSGNYRLVYDHVDPSTGGYQLYIVNADGTNPHLLAGSNTGYSDLRPVWSPDGDRIYFVSSGGIGNFWYYESTDGFATTTNVTRHQISGTANPYVSAGYDVSSDGSTLAFVGDPTDTGCSQLLTMSASGGTPTQLTDTTCTENFELYNNITPSFVDNGWPTASAKNLVALGDSVAAGEGINYGWVWRDGAWVKTGPDDPTWTDATTAYGSSMQSCHQSAQAYDRLFYADGYKVLNMACTSAMAMYPPTGLDYPSEGGHGGVLVKEEFYDTVTHSVVETAPKAQLGSSSVSGADAENENYDAAHPDVVTLTLGADDIDFADWLKQCYDADTTACNSTANDGAIASEISYAKSNLHDVLQEIHDRGAASGKIPQVYITGYYDPFPATYPGTYDSINNVWVSNCVDVVLHNTQAFVGLTPDEITWMRGKLEDLNGAISNEAGQFGNATYVDITGVMQPSEAQADHAYCSDDPWAYGPSIDAPTTFGGAGEDTNPAPFHPTPAGQRAIYNAIKAAMATSTVSVWGNSSTPGTATYSSDTSSVMLGMRFHATTTGQVNAIKVYRGAELTGDTRVFLYNSSGNLLGSGTLAKPSTFTAGWRTVQLDSPVLLNANEVYTAAYLADNGEYAIDAHYFCSGGSVPTSGPVVPEVYDDLLCSSSTGNNGVYDYTTTPGAPTSSYNESNYWVDVDFHPLNLSTMTAASIWSTSTAPTTAAFTGDTDPYTLATRFHTTADGYITDVRLYRGAELNGDTHVYLWGASTGDLLGSGTLTKPSTFTAGWRTVPLDSPVIAHANTTYVVGYVDDNGLYALDTHYFCSGGSVPTSGAVVPELDSNCSSGSGHNGVFNYGTSSPVFPQNTYHENNYWVDVLFRSVP
jgi:Tol biopolymer transport system component/lysophospholipase L1-like esterase